MLCKWILMIRSSLTFGYIWYYYHFYFQNTSDLRNWNKIVIKILWLQGTGTHSSFTSLSNKWDCFKNAKHLHEFPGQEGLSFWKGQNKELNTRAAFSLILGLSFLLCSAWTFSFCAAFSSSLAHGRCMTPPQFIRIHFPFNKPA